MSDHRAIGEQRPARDVCRPQAPAQALACADGGKPFDVDLHEGIEAVASCSEFGTSGSSVASALLRGAE